jgi:hypothetical protein
MVWAAPWLFFGLLGVMTKSWPYRADPLRDEVPISHADASSPHAVAPVSCDEVPIGPSEANARIPFDEVPIGPSDPGVGLAEVSDQRAEFDVWLADFFEDPRETDQADTPDGHAGG